MDILIISLIIVAVIVIAIIYFYRRNVKGQKVETENSESSIDINVLIDALGGIKNIEDISSSPSKVSVILKDQSAVEISKIQSLGASGIVEGKQSLSIIFGKQSSLIEKDIKLRL